MTPDAAAAIVATVLRADSATAYAPIAARIRDAINAVVLA